MGGGIVIVPVLYFLFQALGVEAGVAMFMAVGTSLATIIPTSLSSARSHLKRGSVDRVLLRSLGPAIFVGVVAGTLAAAVVKGPVLTGLFAVLALAVAANMLFRQDSKPLRPSVPEGLGRQGLGAFIGSLSVMVGIGGGTLGVPILTACAVPIHRAVGTAAAIGLIIALPGAVGFALAGWDAAGRPPFSLGYISLLGFACIVPATVLCAPLGARLAHSLRPTPLRRLFAIFLLLTGGRMLYGVLG